MSIFDIAGSLLVGTLVIKTALKIVVKIDVKVYLN